MAGHAMYLLRYATDWSALTTLCGARRYISSAALSKFFIYDYMHNNDAPFWRSRFCFSKHVRRSSGMPPQ